MTILKCKQQVCYFWIKFFFKTQPVTLVDYLMKYMYKENKFESGHSICSLKVNKMLEIKKKTFLIKIKVVKVLTGGDF